MANTYTQTLHPNLHPNCIRGPRPPKSHCPRTQRRTSQIHHRHRNSPGPKINRHSLHARSHSHPPRLKTEHRSFRPIGDIKTCSTNHINENRWVLGRFSWQEGFGAFSYSQSHLSGVADYIHDQVKRHARKTFREEYLQLLKKFEIPHDERYIFKSLDDE